MHALSINGHAQGYLSVLREYGTPEIRQIFFADFADIWVPVTLTLGFLKICNFVNFRLRMNLNRENV